jgi:hypothetical protein
MKTTRIGLVAAALLSAAAYGCGNSSSTGTGGNATTSSSSTTGSSSSTTTGSSSSSGAGTGGGAVTQTPPQGKTAITQWLAQGYYKSWKCEPAVHAQRSPSPHGFDKVCSNDVISGFSGTGPWPVGAAAVKELYGTLTDTTPNGYAVYLKTADDTTAGGSVWYWYEIVPPSTPQSVAPHDATGLVADGMGGSGPPMTICVSCHGAAGMDPAHTPTPGGHDQVYTPVH